MNLSFELGVPSWNTGVMVQDFKVWGFMVWGLGYGVPGFRVLGFRVQALGSTSAFWAGFGRSGLRSGSHYEDTRALG